MYKSAESILVKEINNISKGGKQQYILQTKQVETPLTNPREVTEAGENKYK